jgi:outer membrane protein assembly factor BamB
MTRAFVLATLLLSAHLLAAAARAAEKGPGDAFVPHETGAWPQFGCDPGGTFSTPGALAFPLKIRWTYPREDYPTTHWVAAVMQGGRVYAQSHKWHVVNAGRPALTDCIDSATGKQIWRWKASYEDCYGNYPCIVRDRLFIGDMMACCQLQDGKELRGSCLWTWGHLNYDPEANLLVAANYESHLVQQADVSTNLYGCTPDGFVKWKALHEAGVNAPGRAYMNYMLVTSIPQGAGKVFVGAVFNGISAKTHKDGIWAISQSNGGEVWNLPGEWGGASFDGRHVYAMKNASKAAPASDGHETYKSKDEETAPVTPTLYCLDPDDGKTVWSAVVGEPAYHPPAVARGVCVVITDSGSLLAFSTEGPKTEPPKAEKAGSAPESKARPGYASAPRVSKARITPLWQGKAEPPFKGWAQRVRASQRWASLAIAAGAGPNGALVVTAYKDSVNCFDLKTGRLLQSLPWDKKGGPCNPIIGNGLLVVTSDECVVCYAHDQQQQKESSITDGLTVKFYGGFLKRLDRPGPVKPILEELRRIAENAKEADKADEAKAIITHVEEWGKGELERAKALETQVPTDAEKAYQNLLVRFGGLEPAKTAQERLQDKKFQDDLRSWALVEQMQAAEKRLKDVPGAQRSAKDVEVARVNAVNLGQIKTAAQALAQQGPSPWIIEEANAVLERCGMEKLDKPSAATAPSAPNADPRR